MKALIFLATLVSFITSCTTPSNESSDKKSLTSQHGKMSFLVNVDANRKVSSTEPPTPMLYDGKTNACFSDADLAALMKTNATGLIYVMDSQMPLSFLTLEHIKRVAQNRKLPLAILFSSSQESVDLARLILRNSKYTGPAAETLMMCSDRLTTMGATLHYPNLFVYKNSQLVTKNFLGAKSAANYETFVASVLDQNEVPLGTSSIPETVVDKTQEPSQWREVRRMKIEGIPGYYFKPLAGGEWVLYTKRPWMVKREAKHDLASASFMKNHLLNLRTGQEYRIGGFVDPVPTPDEKIMSHPNVMGDYNLRLTRRHSLYSLKDLMAGKPWRETLIMTDTTVPGTYQSFGMYTNDQGQTVYRMVAETIFDYFTPATMTKQHNNQPDRFFTQEYTLDESKGKPRLIQTYRQPQTFCPNLKFSLPMLSKTGQLFAGADTYTRESKIMRVLPDKCENVVTIGIPTGKVDFAYDDSAVTFHVSWTYGSEPNTTYLNIPKLRHNMDVMTFDIKSRELRRVTQCQSRNANCYYPAFTKAGQIVYLEQNRETNTYEFVVIEKK